MIGIPSFTEAVRLFSGSRNFVFQRSWKGPDSAPSKSIWYEELPKIVSWYEDARSSSREENGFLGMTTERWEMREAFQNQ